MGKMFFFGALLALGCAGTGLSEPEEWGKDEFCAGIGLDVDAQLEEPAEKAVYAWNDALGREAFWIGSAPVPVSLVDDIPRCNGDRCWSSWGRSATYTATGEPLWVEVWREAPAAWTLLHELGHLLGIEHTDEGMMRDGARQGDAPYAVDEWALNAVRYDCLTPYTPTPQ